MTTGDLFPHKNSPLLNKDASSYRRYGATPHPSLVTQLVGDYFEHLASYHLQGSVINHTAGELPDLISDRHRALVEVKGSHVRTALKVQVHQIYKLQNCIHQGWDRRWFVIFLHEAERVAQGLLTCDEVLEELSSKNRLGLVVDVSIMRAFVEQKRVTVCGPYQGKDGGWTLPPIASFRAKRDLIPLAERTESTLCELHLNPEDYDIYREVANTYTNPFILSWIVPRGSMKKILKERNEGVFGEVPF